MSKSLEIHTLSGTMNKWLKILASAGILSCTVAPPNTTTISELVQLPSLDRSAIPNRDAGALRSAALKYYAQGDYVRALRFGYWAAQTIPTDVRLRLLLGIVYDGGFDRPDLALPEYRRALSLKPAHRFEDRLRRRVHHLNRRLLQDSVKKNLMDGSGNPLSENWLAVYPLRVSGPRLPQTGLEIALLDWVLPEIKRRSPGLHVDPFTSLIVAQVYREVANDPTAEAFARWCGAGAILTGQLTDLGNDQLRIVIELLDSAGNLAYESNPVYLDGMDPEAVHGRLLQEAGTALGLLTSDDEIVAPIANSAALALYSEGLAQYFIGQVSEAEMNVSDAIELNPGSTFLENRLFWVKSDLMGSSEGAALLDDYHRLLRLPDPDQLLRDRLARGHSLISPAPNGTSGEETENPYKAPQPGTPTP
ncbi:MAG: hypothetical protein VX910_12630 [Candidatus Latescibacterota bacterium]|nr:hypothetical protein [Candidatus Latescibacterota bacterium]